MVYAAIFPDRYGGVYSEGSLWVAMEEPEKHLTTEEFAVYHGGGFGKRRIDMFLEYGGPWGDDGTAQFFWEEFSLVKWLAHGKTPDIALANLSAKFDGNG